MNRLMQKSKSWKHNDIDFEMVKIAISFCIVVSLFVYILQYQHYLSVFTLVEQSMLVQKFDLYFITALFEWYKY